MLNRDFREFIESLNSNRVKYLIFDGYALMSKYEIIIFWSEEDAAFIAEVSELAGCMADGASYKEAVANAEIVIQEWIETARNSARQIPEPKGRLVFA